MTEVVITVGGAIDTKAQFLEAICKYEAGELIDEQPIQIHFENFEQMARILSPMKLELLQHIYRTPTASTRQLAERLGRSYADVHADVQTLLDTGLLDRDEDGLHTDCDQISYKMT